MYLVVGLGNPGLKYKKTPHNAGFLALDALADILQTRFNKNKFEGKIAESVICGEKILLLKPQTFMNLSGNSVVATAQYYHISNDHIVLIYDDKDLDLGKIRIRAKGSAGSHNGMKSVIECLRTEQFPRIRFGIGKPPEGMRLMDYVLHKVGRQEREVYLQTAERCARAAIAVVTDGLEIAQQKYSSK